MLARALKGIMRWLREPPLIVRQLRSYARFTVTRFRLRRNAGRAAPRRPHGLPGELIVSLTSYPPRYPTLHLTLESLLQQDTASDRLILWIAHADMAALPAKVLALQARGLSIRPCVDTRSYKKLLPALAAYPAAYLVTADDDIHYAPDWLGQLVAGVEPGGQVIVAHMVKRIAYDGDGRIAPFSRWRDGRDDASRVASTDLLPIGMGGVLYPPGSLGPDVAGIEVFRRLAPDGDDLAFYWASRRHGSLHKKVGPVFPKQTWPRSQRMGLWTINKHGGNDRQLAALVAEAGRPGPP